MLVDGKPCGAPAATVQHVIALTLGGPVFDPANMVAACGPCNYADGARLGREHPAPAQLSERQALVVQLLDAAGARSDVGRRRALAAVPGLPASPADIDAACAWRRQRGTLEPRDW